MTEAPVTGSAAGKPPPQAVLLDMWSGYLVSRSLYVVAELAIADHLAEGPKQPWSWQRPRAPTGTRFTGSFACWRPGVSLPKRNLAAFA